MSVPGEVQSVQRAITVLRAFARADEWSTSALARELGLHKSVVHRLLVTLTRGGLLRQDERTSSFRLAPAMVSLGRRAERANDVLTIARPFLQRLVEESQETVSLCVLQDDHGVCLASVDSPQSMRFTISPGENFPLNAGGVGKVILAFQPDSFVDALIETGTLRRFTDRTITSPEELRRELARIRLQGYGFSDAEITPGARSVGAPVRDADGKVPYSLAISAPSLRMTDARLPQFVAMVRQAAAALSGELGYQDAVDAASAQTIDSAA
ncbi:MAG: IclR family transcriptional regulator [Rhodospirillales bacterium]|nr:IclR family transcriptional regulator [Rhodospirillales bacterium]